MRNDTWRLAFALFLERLACENKQPLDWYDHVITQYPDDELDEVRRELVRLSIARDPLGNPVWLASDREQFRQWAKYLRGPVVAEPGE